jgi:hypothetical protein
MLVGTAAGESADVVCHAAAGQVALLRRGDAALGFVSMLSGTAAGESADVACHAAAGPDTIQKGGKGATMVSQMAVSWSKRPVPSWFQKCILYLGSKAMLYYTSFTVGDNRSR